MTRQELTCQHGVGHSGGVHGCDGCCAIIAEAVEQRIIKLLEDEGSNLFALNYLIALINGENEINNKIILTPEEFDGLEKSLTEPAKPNENLNKLLKGNK